MTLCRCCFIANINTGFSHTERPVMLCGECGHHYSDGEKRARSHEKMMETIRVSHAIAMERLEAKRVAVVAGLEEANEKIQTLTATITSDYKERPIGDIQKLLEDAAVADANLRASNALKSRDWAMAAVFRIDELHNEVGDNCSCGERLADCGAFQALDFFRATYYAWENRQIERLNQGKPHGLPLDHPKGKAYRGRPRDWKGLRSTRPDVR